MLGIGVILVAVAIGLGVWCVFTILSPKEEREEELSTADEMEKLKKVSEGLSPSEVNKIRLSAMLGTIVVGYLLTGNIIVGLVLSGVAYPLPKFVEKRRKRQRLERFNDQLVDAIGLIANSLKSGFSFLQGVGLLVRELPPPISQEFKIVMYETQLGVSLEESLNNLGKRIKSDDLDLVITATVITRETGGNLAEIYGRIASTIRARNAMQGKIKALTSQGKLQGISASLLPVALLILLNKIAPEMVKPLFTQPKGIMMLLGAAVLIGIGGFLIRKIIAIDI